MFKRIVVTGSLAYDHIMSMPTSFSDHIMPDKLHILNVSFIMQKFQKEFGGTGGNIAYTLSLLGIPTLLAATAGNDFSAYLKHLKKQKSLDTTGIKTYKSLPTAQGFVMTDQNDNQIWGFYEGAMKKGANINLAKLLRKGDFLVIAPNDPLATITYTKVAIKLKIPYMFDPAFNIPHFSKPDLKLAINNAEILVGNDYEIELIKRRLKPSRIKSNIIITTLGSKGSIIAKASKTIKVPAAKPKNTSDPTGAGDCYRAGFLAGYFKGLSLEVCGGMGATSSIYTVEKYGTQTHKFTKKQFMKRYQENFGRSILI